MSSELEIQHCSGVKIDLLKIMTQASVFLQTEPATAVEIRRGMVFRSADGQDAGSVAGVVVNPESQQVVCIILSHLPGEANYQSLPVRWIERVDGKVITLNVALEITLDLPGWHTP